MAIHVVPGRSAPGPIRPSGAPAVELGEVVAVLGQVSGTASLEVVADDPTPPYEQLRRQFVALIESGTLERGQRLPPVRQLASDLGLVVGTVARTYRELEQAGLVSTRRGGGSRVRADLARRDPAERVHDLDVGAEVLVRTARLLGAGTDEVRAAVDRALSAPG